MVAKGDRLAEAIVRMVAEQGGLCKTCGREGPLNADHCHESGYLRGMICRSCNSLLARVGDDIEALRRRAAIANALADYLASGTTDIWHSKPDKLKVKRQKTGFSSEAQSPRTKLEAWLVANNQKPAHFAKQIGVSKVTIHYWLKGERQPKPAVALKIRNATGGLVDLADLYG